MSSKKTEIYQSIRQSIISGGVQPGAMLNESDLANQHGVSRTPVREALLILSSEGLVNVLPRAGYMVSQISVRDVQEAFHLREILEVEACRLAVGYITDDDIADLEKYKIGIPHELNPGYNRKFHLIIAHASGSGRLARLVEQLLDEMQRMLVYDPMISGPHEPNEHDAIVEGLCRKDAEAAQAGMRAHIRAVKSRVLERFK